MTMDRKTQGLSFRRRLLVAEIASLLMAGGYVGQYFSADNRVYLFFGLSDVAAIFLLVFGVGGLIAVLLHGLAHWTGGRSDTWLSPWFYFWAILAFAQFFPNGRKHLALAAPWLSGTLYYLFLWGVGAGLAMASYFSPRLRAGAQTGWRMVMMMWPLLLMLPLSLWMADKWDNEQRNPIPLEKNAAGHGAPVVIFILDKMGYSEVFGPEGAVHPYLPHLSALAASSMVFHHARSCGHVTIHSVPGFLLQEEVGLPQLRKDGVYWSAKDNDRGDFRRADEFKRALPRRFQAEGGRAVLFGYYLPWNRMMPGMWDGVRSVPYYGVCRSSPKPEFKLVVLNHLARYFKYHSKGPIGALLKKLDLLEPLFDRYARDLTLGIVESVKTFVRGSLSPGDLVIVHLPIPHEPFVFDADGGPSRFAPLDFAGYPDQLRYADRVFGAFVEALKQAGQWDASWVLVMSDHGVHEQAYGQDPVEIRHVPLIVKAPGQTTRREMGDPIRLWTLEEIPGFPPPDDSRNSE